ncbi:hypothetical protein SASPL_121481 [Salvia splendens]|uniref:Uncharacterized protein n=1 Tax=Salvia splendens TaxID=180675 RepID=A0A8X8XRK3_SALSN|nr:hypothetical protein SASPL_121481 [Salvia splendens]
MGAKGVAFVMGMLIFCILVVSSAEGRKLLMKVENSNNGSLYLASLPKGNVPASTPSKRSHATTFDRNLIARHLAALNRILGSVPSPGVGH